MIPIDVGRQLFIDDFLIAETNMERRFIMPTKYEGNPVLKPETPLEMYPRGPMAAPLSGGLWWDYENQIFKMWYGASFASTLALATSKDGKNWDRPELPTQWGTTPNTNEVLPTFFDVDTYSVIPDWNEDGTLRRYTLSLRAVGARDRGAMLMTSEDGIRWVPQSWTGGLGDKSTHFFNPFRNQWVYSIRSWPNNEVKRSRSYWESDTFEEGHWRRGQPPFWLRTDRLDLPDPDIGAKPQLYNFDAIAYESIMLGFFQLHLGPENDYYKEIGLPKVTELQFAYSRDGFHFDRPDRRAHIPAERRDVWDRAYVQSVAGACVVMGDELWIYYTGFQGDEEWAGESMHWTENGMYRNGSTGIAKLRRDGFAAMEAGEQGGQLTTRPIVFSGKHLFVNAETGDGQIRAEIRDLNGRPIAPYTLDNSIPFTGNSTLEGLNWRGVNDLSRLAGQPVQIHFELTGGQLYSFWISPDENGQSNGFVGAGGPGYTKPRDTQGRQALDAFRAQFQ